MLIFAVETQRDVPCTRTLQTTHQAPPCGLPSRLRHCAATQQAQIRAVARRQGLPVLPPPQVAFKPLQGLLRTPAAVFLRLGHKFKTTLLAMSAAACTAVPAQAATPLSADTAATRGWYLGAEGGVPFAVSTFASFAGGRTYAGWQAGVSAGYSFGRTVSLEAQASWGRPALAARRCCTESGYWLGADGRRYYAPASGMEGWTTARWRAAPRCKATASSST